MDKPDVSGRLSGRALLKTGLFTGGGLLVAAVFLFTNLLHIIEELQEHHPRQHRQPVEVTVKTFVLAHDVASRLHEAREALGRSKDWLRLLSASWGFRSDGEFGQCAPQDS